MNDVKALNWSGSLPIELSLSSTSLSSPAAPPPQFILASRQSYLHVALDTAVSTLSKSAVIAVLNTSSHWFEDDNTGLPLRWQLPIGVVFDLLHLSPPPSSAAAAAAAGGTSTSSPKQLHQQSSCPWKIKLHFTSYPESNHQILQCPRGVETVRQYFTNSLKQSLYLQHGSSKVAMSITKQAHGSIWDSIRQGKYALYALSSKGLQASGANMIPVRLLVDHYPAIQKPCKTKIAEVDSTSSILTLGDLLEDWLSSEKLSLDNISYCIQGIKPSVSTPVELLWEKFCCPDQFLYIVAKTP